MDGFPQFDLAGQVALVTGAARGLGRAISLALANAGADVALGLRDASTGAALTSNIQALGRRTDLHEPQRSLILLKATGRVQIAGGTHRLVHHLFACEERGLIGIKGKGEMPAWLVLDAGSR